MPNKTYIIRSRFLVPGEGWKIEDQEISCSYEEAGRKASSKAKELDAIHGDSHFWTVNLQTPDHEDYYQFFHGRTE
jgi:hypothetical protein